MYNCITCNRSFTKLGALGNHKKTCKLKRDLREKNISDKTCPICSFYVSNNYGKHFNSCKGRGPRGKRLPLTQEEKDSSKIKKNKKLKEKWKDPLFKKQVIDKMKNSGGLTGRSKTDELEKIRKDKISKSMKRNPNSGGYRKGSGIGKSGKYNGIWCDSSWELAWVIFNIENGISFVRNTEKFGYLYKGIQYFYIPDFIVNGEYVEIKGRRNFNGLSGKDKEKIIQFKKPLTVLYENDMKKYIEYVISVYGIDFIRLYE